MYRIAKLIRPFALTLLVSSLGACAVGVRDRDYYDDDYRWYYTRYGTYTIVRRPVVVVDRWTTRAFRYRPYRGYHIRRHNSPVITYTATRGNSTLEVSLTPRGDSTQIDVRARTGEDDWDQKEAQALARHILQNPN